MLSQVLLLPFNLLKALFVPFFVSLLCVAVYMFYKLYVRTKLRMHHYVKQGIPTYYVPVLGTFFRQEVDFANHGDHEYSVKRDARTNPKRMLCTNLASNVHLYIYDPVLIKSFFMSADCYVKDDIGIKIFSTLLGTGLISAEGAEWKRQRKVISNVFHFEFLKSIVPNIQATARKNLKSLQTTGLKNVDIMDELQRTAGEVIGKVFFGEQLSDYKFEGKSFTTGLAALIAETMTLNLSLESLVLGASFIMKGILPKHRILMNRMRAFRSICEDIVKQRKQEKENNKRSGTPDRENGRKDMLEVLLDYKGDEGGVTDKEIIDQFVSFFLAGMDSVGHLVIISLWMLDQNPEVRIKLQEELNQRYYTEEVASTDVLNQLEYTTAFLKETMRQKTPAIGIFPRKVVKDHYLKDIHIKKGDLVSLNYFYNSFNPEYFRDPDHFDPERWLGKEKLSDAYAFTPFSAGPRNCIGQHLGMSEAKILLAEFLRMYDFKVPEGYKLKLKNKFLYGPDEQLMLDLTAKDL